MFYEVLKYVLFGSKLLPEMCTFESSITHQVFDKLFLKATFLQKPS